MKHQNRQLLNEGWRFQFEDETPQEVTLPHTWNALDTMAVDPDQHYRRGTGVYTQILQLPQLKHGERLWLEIEAASQYAKVFVDGQQINEHWGGYTAFIQELFTDRAQIELRVEVNNSPNPDLIPSDMSDFFLFGGLTRNVWLYQTGPNRVESLYITPYMDGQVVLHGNLTQAGQIDLRVLSPENKTVAQLKSTVNKDFELEIEIPVMVWHPDQPYLYKLEMNLAEEDHIVTHFGFREFVLHPHGPFELNGQPLLLRGTHRHEDWAGYGSAIPDKLSWQELELIKEAGFNFIRLGHYPQAKAVLEACDKLGLLVWIELPWCRGGIGDTLFRDRARHMFIEMVEQYYNHPSIIFWGLGNELDWESEHPASTPAKVVAFLQELHDLSHELDPLRLTALRRFEPGAEIVDVYSPSIWSGWYRGRYEDYELALTEAIARFPNFFHAEWGGDSHVGRHNIGPHLSTEIEVSDDHAEIPGIAISNEGFSRASRDGDWSESYMLDVMEWHLQVQARFPNLSGTAQWIFSDFGTPLRPENPIPYVNQKGIVDRARRKKDIYYLFQTYQTETPTCYIESPTWRVRIGHQKQRIRVYSNCEYVTLYVNDVPQACLQRNSSTFPAGGLVWHVDLQLGNNNLRAVGETHDGKLIEHRITHKCVPLTNKPSTQVLPSFRLVDQKILLDVQLADKDGIPVFKEGRLIISLIEGGNLVALRGTSDGSHIVETANGYACFTIIPVARIITVYLCSPNFTQTIKLDLSQ